MPDFAGLSLFGLLAELTPIQRFEAARELSSGLSANRWFLILAVAAIVILAILFVFATLYRRKYEFKISRNTFSDYAKQRGLSAKQKDLLFRLADKVGFKRKEAIFNLPVEFERSASRIISETLSSEGTQKAFDMRKEIFEIRRKLGFNTYFTKGNNYLKSSRTTSRDIEEGKEVYLTSLENSSIEDIKAVVVENNEMELKVKPSVLIDTSPGKHWRISYSSGAAVWEFDTTIFNVESNLITFSHSSEVRYINRRRFLRTKVDKPALIADFPFSRRIAKKVHNGSQEDEQENEGTEKQYTINPPDFVSARVTELAGPGLRIETDINVDIGQRLLVVFELEKQHMQKKSKRKAESTEKGNDNILIQEVGVVEEVAEVKRKQSASGRNVIAVELVGLSDNILDDLVKATNEAAVKSDSESDEGSRRDNKKADTAVNV